MQCGTVLYALLWRRGTKETTAFLLCILVVILCTCLENPVFFLRMRLFYNQSTILNNLLSFISVQFVQEVNHTYYIYWHRDPCAMLLRIELHGKSKKLMIKAVSIKLDFLDFAMVL